jgi:hypothetical protein
MEYYREKGPIREITSICRELDKDIGRRDRLNLYDGSPAMITGPMT